MENKILDGIFARVLFSILSSSAVLGGYIYSMLLSAIAAVLGGALCGLVWSREAQISTTGMLAMAVVQNCNGAGSTCSGKYESRPSSQASQAARPGSQPGSQAGSQASRMSPKEVQEPPELKSVKCI